MRRTRRRATRGATCALAFIALATGARGDGATTPLARHSTKGVVEQLVWIRHKSIETSRVFAVTEYMELLYSSDDGRTMNPLTERELRGVDSLTMTPLLITGAQGETGELKGAPQLVIQDVYGEFFWGSSDLGTTWMQPCVRAPREEECFMNPAQAVPGARGLVASAIRMHPTREKWLLAFVKSCAAQSSECDVFRLVVSDDFGKSWTDLVENSKGKIASFVDFEWAPDDGSSTNPGIYATVYRDKTAFERRETNVWDRNVDLIVSDDLFKSHRVVEECANAFEILNGDIYSAAPSDCAEYRKKPSEKHGAVDDITLRISIDNGATFTETCFPMDLKKNAFVIYDFHADDAGPDFISVDHQETDVYESHAPMNQLYASDDSLTFFSLSMRRNLRSPVTYALEDLVKVQGVDGVYVGNQISYKAFSRAATNGDYSQFYESRVTYNAGGTWHKIPVPRTDAEGLKYACSSADFDCERYGLHLHGAVDWDSSEDWSGRLGGVYSRSSAPGIIISTGNVGDYLRMEPDDVNTYISRDAGITWEETKKGAYIYEFGNHGGLLVIAKQFEAVSQIEYSLNEGKTWQAIKLAVPTYVHNIRVDPSSKGHVFIIHGMADVSRTQDPSQGAHFVIDFDEIIQKGKTCGDADYETFVPEAPGSKGCLMGQTYHIKRKRREAECFNDANFEFHHEVVGTCTCTRVHDTECDYGSERVYNVPNATEWPHCEKLERVNTACPALKSKHVTSTNLRIVAGDKCTNRAAALGDGERRHHGGGFFHRVMKFFLIVAALGAAAYGFMFATQNYDFGTITTTVPNAARNAFNGAYEKFQDHFGKREPRPAGYFEPLGDFAGEDEI